MLDSPPSRGARVRFALLVVAACAVVYGNGVTGAFTYDDKAIIRDNPRIRSPRNLKEIFSTSYFGGPRGSGSAYRPVLILSYAVQWWIHGRDVVAFHVANVAIHAAVTVLLWWLLLRLGLAPPAGATAALLFAVHPLHVEAVTSLVGRGETLCALFVLLYLHCGLTLRRRQSLSIHFFALASFAAAVLTKESGAVAPALAFLLFVFLSEGPIFARLGQALRGGLALLLGSAAVLLAIFRLRSWVLGGPLRSASAGVFEVENALAPLKPATRMANACLIFFRYLGRCVFPLHLSGDESAWSIRPLPLLSPWTVAATVLLILLALVSLARLRARSFEALGFLFFALSLLPTSNLLFPIGTIFAERIAYLPSAGACLILGSVLAGGAGEALLLPATRRSAILAIVLLFSVRTILRNAVWWTDEGLFANLTRTAPRSAKAHYDRAYAAADQRRDQLARQEYRAAIAIYDRYWDAWAGKGRAEKGLGLFAEAERSYERSISVNSTYENGYFGLGQVREARGDDRGAEKAYRDGLERVPRSLPLAYHLALVSGRRGEKQAPADWKTALELGGGLCSVRSDYARYLFGLGQVDRAGRQAREALRRDPGCVGALGVLADRAQRNGMRLSRALALEKIWRATRSPADWKRFEAARTPAQR